jgi:RecJ-like exonuclease
MIEDDEPDANAEDFDEHLMAPGDEEQSGGVPSDEQTCMSCGGSGVVDGASCEECEGTGTVGAGSEF